MEEASTQCSDSLRVALPASEQAYHRAGEGNNDQQTRTSVDGPPKNIENVTSGDGKAAVLLPQAQAATLGGRINEDLLHQPVSLPADAAAVSNVFVEKTKQAPTKEKEAEHDHEHHKQNHIHGREQILLWNVKKGLAPIAAAALNGCGGKVSALETPSSGGTDSLTKAAAALEEETPRTNIPSLEVSPTNNTYVWKNCAFSGVPSTSTTLNSTSSSSTPSPSRVRGANDADGGDSCSFITGTAQSPAEILVAAAAAAANDTAEVADAPAARTVGITQSPGSSPTSAQTVSVSSSGNGAAETAISTKYAAGVDGGTSLGVVLPGFNRKQLIITTGDAAAVLSSPAALTLLATPCPIGATGNFNDTAQSTSTAQRPAGKPCASFELPRTADIPAVISMHPEISAAPGIDTDATAEGGVRDRSVIRVRCMNHDAAAQLRASEDLQETTTNWMMQKAGSRRLPQGGRSGVCPPDIAAAQSSSNQKENCHESSLRCSDANLILMRREGENLLAEKSVLAAAQKEKAAAEREAPNLAESATGSEEPGRVCMGDPLSCAREDGNAGRHNGPCVLWESTSHLDADLGDAVAAAPTTSSSSDAPLNILCQKQKQLYEAETEDPLNSFSHASAAIAPLSATSGCTDLSASPFVTAFKGDISPVSCCSSSSTASRPSPTSSPLSSASCGGTLTMDATASTAAPDAGDGLLAGTREPAPAASSESTAACGKGRENKLKNSTVAIPTSLSSEETREHNTPTWHVGFRLPLGAEGRQVLLRRLRRAYHAAPPATRDAALASHGLYFSRVPFATVSDLFKLSHLLGVFDFAVQCSQEFGGSGGGGGSGANGAGGAHGNKKNNHHPKNSNRGNHVNNQQLCSGTGNSGEETTAPGSCADAAAEVTTQANVAPQVGVAPAGAVAAGSQKKHAGGMTSKPGAAAAFGPSPGARKGGSGKALQHVYLGKAGITARGVDVERAVSTTARFEGVLGESVRKVREGGGAGGGDASTKSEDAEITFVSKETTAARIRFAQRRRSATGRSSACRAAIRQQQLQEQQENHWKEVEALETAQATAGYSDGGESSICGESQESHTHQYALLQQLLQVVVRDHTGFGDAGGIEGKNIPAAILKLFSGESGKSASPSTLPPAGGGSSATNESQQQWQLAEQLVMLQSQDHAKTFDPSCRGGRNRTTDRPVDSREPCGEQDQRQQLALERLLIEALRGAEIGGPQHQTQSSVVIGGKEDTNGGRAECKRIRLSKDAGLQHEQRPWSSRLSSTGAAGGEVPWSKQPHDAPERAPPRSAAEPLSFLTSGVDQRYSNDCCVPPVGVVAGNVSCPESGEVDRLLSGPEIHESRHNTSNSLGGDSFDWREFFMKNFWSSMREQQQRPHQRSSDALTYAPSGPSTSTPARIDALRTADCAGAISAPDRPPPEEIMQEEEVIRRSKRLRTTHYPIAATWNAEVLPSGTSPSFSAAAGAISVPETRSGPAATVTHARPPGRDDPPQAYTPEEEALLLALMSTAGSSPEDQLQRRWTFNTVEEIKRLLLQLNNNNSSGSVAEEKEPCRAGSGQCTNQLHPEDNIYNGGGCEHSLRSTNLFCSSNSTCSRLPMNISSCSSNTTNCSGIGQDGCSFGGNSGDRHSSSFTSNTRTAEKICTSASLGGTAVDGAIRFHQHDNTKPTRSFASHPEKEGVSTHKSHGRCGVPSFPNAISAAIEQLQRQLLHRSEPSRGVWGSRNGCSDVAIQAATDSYRKVSGQAGNSSSSRRDAYIDIFSQLTSQLQLLSGQVFQQQEPGSAPRHLRHGDVFNQQQYDPRTVVQPGYESLGKKGDGPLALTHPRPAAAQGEPGALASGRLCSAGTATEYAAGVQLLQLVELLQVQQRVSKLLSLFPKIQAANSSLSDLSALLDAASPFPPSPAATISPAPAGPAAAAATFSAPDAAGSAKSSPAATEPYSTLVAALARTLLESTSGAAVLNDVKQAPSALPSLASKHVDIISSVKKRDSDPLLQQSETMYDPKQQQEQHVPLPQRSPYSRRNNSKTNNSKTNNSKTNNSKSSAGRATKGHCVRNTDRARHSQSDETKCFSEDTDSVDVSAGAAAEAGLVHGGKESNADESPATSLKQQETTAPSNCVAHSNSFSTCCSEDLAELYTTGNSNSSMNCNHGDSAHVCGGGCNVQATFERAYTHDSYTCNSETREDIGVCLQ